MYPFFSYYPPWLVIGYIARYFPPASVGQDLFYSSLILFSNISQVGFSTIFFLRISQKMI